MCPYRRVNGVPHVIGIRDIPCHIVMFAVKIFRSGTAHDILKDSPNFPDRLRMGVRDRGNIDFRGCGSAHGG